MIAIRHAYLSAAERVQLEPVGESRAVQASKAECDINTIMARYFKTGVIEHVRAHPLRFEELPGGMDYHTSLNLVLAAQRSFEGLPGHVRSRFGNDAQAFLTFVEDPANASELVDLGLAVAPSALSASAADVGEPALVPAEPAVAGDGA